MKKKVLTIILMVSIVSAGIFAANQQRLSNQDGLNSNPMYIELSDGSYKNVETDEVVSASELPEYCQLVGGDGQKNEANMQLNRNISKNDSPRFDNGKGQGYNDDSNKRSNLGQRNSSRSSKNSNYSRNFQNR